MRNQINITYAGNNGDYFAELDETATDGDIKRIAEEAVRNGEVAEISNQNLPEGALFENFVVDRFALTGQEGTRFMIRAKVPMGNRF